MSLFCLEIILENIGGFFGKEILKYFSPKNVPKKFQNLWQNFSFFILSTTVLIRRDPHCSFQAPYCQTQDLKLTVRKPQQNKQYFKLKN